MLNNISKQLELYNVSRETLVKLEKYVELLLKWNKSINLIGRDTENDIWIRHIIDSVQLLSYIDNQDVTLTDFGSGAGFPGLVLSFLGIKKVHLIESDMRKSIFLKEASMLSDNEVVIHNNRIEKLEPWVSDVITARALSQLPSLLKMVYPFKGKDSYCLFLKGKNINDEIIDAQKEFQIDYKLLDSITDVQAKIIKIYNFVSK